jgi:uncharacterized heparinase superfamily protein
MTWSVYGLVHGRRFRLSAGRQLLDGSTFIQHLQQNQQPNDDSYLKKFLLSKFVVKKDVAHLIRNPGSAGCQRFARLAYIKQ